MWIKRQIPHIVNNIIVSFVVSLRILSFNWLSAVLFYWAYTVTLHSQYLAFESTRKGLTSVVGPSHPPRRKHQTRSRRRLTQSGQDRVGCSTLVKAARQLQRVPLRRHRHRHRGVSSFVPIRARSAVLRIAAVLLC